MTASLYQSASTAGSCVGFAMRLDSWRNNHGDAIDIAGAGPQPGELSLERDDHRDYDVELLRDERRRFRSCRDRVWLALAGLFPAASPGLRGGRGPRPGNLAKGVSVPRRVTR